MTIAPNDENVPPLTFTPAVFGPTTNALLNFMESAVSLQTPQPLNSQRRQVQRTRVVSPKALFNQICNKWVYFYPFYFSLPSYNLLQCLLWDYFSLKPFSPKT